jgi:hypothetical protein
MAVGNFRRVAMPRHGLTVNKQDNPVFARLFAGA